MKRNRAVGIRISGLGTRWRNVTIAIAGQPGALTPVQVTGATGGIFQNAASGAGQFNLPAPGSGRLEGQPFRVVATGWVKIPAGTFTATLVAALYGVAGSALWTAASGNQIALSGSQSYTQAGTTAVIVPFEVDCYCEGDSTSGILQGVYDAVVNNTFTAITKLANNPTGVNFATEPPLQFAAGVTLTNAGTGAICQLDQLKLIAD